MATFIKGEPSRKNVGQQPEVLMKFAKELRDNPGVWAVHPDYETEYKLGSSTRHNSATTTVANINNGRIASLREGFEARSASGIVYVRYLEREDLA